MIDDIEQILFEAKDIEDRIRELATKIEREYNGKRQPLTVVCLLHGGMFFMTDLLRRINLPLRIETISVASYHGGILSSGVVTIKDVKLPDLTGRHVILLDDILDTGRTLSYLCERLTNECNAQSVRTCVLLRKNKQQNIMAHYIGFDIEDEFVVGYGLDYQEHYRNLPFIGILKPSVYESQG